MFCCFRSWLKHAGQFSYRILAALAAFTITLGMLAGPGMAETTSVPVKGGNVVDGKARFTVIIPTLMRLEYSRNAKFINDRSYFAWHRRVKPPQSERNIRDGGADSLDKSSGPGISS